MKKENVGSNSVDGFYWLHVEVTLPQLLAHG